MQPHIYVDEDICIRIFIFLQSKQIWILYIRIVVLPRSFRKEPLRPLLPLHDRLFILPLLHIFGSISPALGGYLSPLLNLLWFFNRAPSRIPQIDPPGLQNLPKRFPNPSVYARGPLGPFPIFNVKQVSVGRGRRRFTADVPASITHRCLIYWTVIPVTRGRHPNAVLSPRWMAPVQSLSQTTPPKQFKACCLFATPVHRANASGTPPVGRGGRRVDARSLLISHDCDAWSTTQYSDIVRPIAIRVLKRFMSRRSYRAIARWPIKRRRCCRGGRSGGG